MRTFLETSDIIVRAGQKQNFRTMLRHRTSRWWMSVALIISDAASITLAISIALFVRTTFRGPVHDIQVYYRLLPALLLFVSVYAMRGLYPAVGLSPVEELRQLSTTTSFLFLIITGFTFWVRTSEEYSRIVFALGWLIALVLVQANRWLLRVILSRLGLWGEPVAVVGFGTQGKDFVRYIQNHSRFGMTPSLVIAGAREHEEPLENIPIVYLNGDEKSIGSISSLGISTAILIVREIPEKLLSAIIDEGRFGFQRLILISSLGWIGSLGVKPYDLEGILGLEVQQNLLNPLQGSIKRLMDIFLVLGSSLISLPTIGLIYLLVKIGSPGPGFYGHRRLARNGKRITVWKFRTMVADADEILYTKLEENPQLKSEWEQTQKLKNDPRVTRIGAWLRKTSLDELPQIWNVLKGEMSIVGPRPIVSEEVKHYKQRIKLYSRVRPGITGLWQVSGRSDVGYESRVRLDEFYVRNWSIWLDIYIMIRTVLVVLRGKGAY